MSHAAAVLAKPTYGVARCPVDIGTATTGVERRRQTQGAKGRCVCTNGKLLRRGKVTLYKQNWQLTDDKAIILKHCEEIRNLKTICPTDSEYGKKMNSVYEEGIAFTMLHEYAHFALQHRGPSLANEIAADKLAMQILYERSETT